MRGRYTLYIPYITVGIPYLLKTCFFLINQGFLRGHFFTFAMLCTTFAKFDVTFVKVRFNMPKMSFTMAKMSFK
jgi:hypothetical protein